MLTYKIIKDNETVGYNTCLSKDWINTRQKLRIEGKDAELIEDKLDEVAATKL